MIPAGLPCGSFRLLTTKPDHAPTSCPSDLPTANQTDTGARLAFVRALAGNRTNRRTSLRDCKNESRRLALRKFSASRYKTGSCPNSLSGWFASANQPDKDARFALLRALAGSRTNRRASLRDCMFRIDVSFDHSKIFPKITSPSFLIPRLA
jgi:hypothetical protein